MEDKVKRALEIAHDGSIDGEHHKMWVIDQMVRVLTGCPIIKLSALDYKGNKYQYNTQGKSEEYLHWIKEHCGGEDGDDTYSWDEGIAP